jgi:hypothetical protein
VETKIRRSNIHLIKLQKEKHRKSETEKGNTQDIKSDTVPKQMKDVLRFMMLKISQDGALGNIRSRT